MSDQTDESSFSTSAVSRLAPHAISARGLASARNASLAGLGLLTKIERCEPVVSAGEAEAQARPEHCAGEPASRPDFGMRAARGLVARRELWKCRTCRDLAIRRNRATLKVCRAPSRGRGDDPFMPPSPICALGTLRGQYSERRQLPRKNSIQLLQKCRIMSDCVGFSKAG